MIQIICDYCEQDFTVSPQETMIEEGISKVHFFCPHCDKEYISYYIDDRIKEKQATMRELLKKQRKNRNVKDITLAAKLNKGYQRLKKEIKKDMDKLKVRIEKI